MLVLTAVIASAGVFGCDLRPDNARPRATPPSAVGGGSLPSHAGEGGAGVALDASAASALPEVPVPAALADAAPEPLPIDMLFWENQSWKPGGASERLTLWADGRSEIWVIRPGLSLSTVEPTPRQGWKLVRAKPPRFVRTNPLPKAEARQRFAAAASAGIDQLKTFRPEYHDGSGTLVGYRRGGAVHEIVVPMFAPAQKGSENEQRYRAVAAVMAKFDTAAYE